MEGFWQDKNKSPPFCDKPESLSVKTTTFQKHQTQEFTMDTVDEGRKDETTVNSQVVQKSKEEVKKKARIIPPTEMFDKMYGARAPTQEQANSLKMGNTSPVPKQVVALIKRRMNGARTRDESARYRIKAYQVKVRTRRSVDESGHEVNLPQSEVQSYKSKLLEARAERMKAQGLFADYKQLYEEALESQAGQLRKGMNDIRKDRAAERETPRYVKRSLDLMDQLGINGAAPEVGGIRSAAKAGDRTQFKDGLLGFLASHDKKMSHRLDEIPRLKQRVVARTMRELKKLT